MSTRERILDAAASAYLDHGPDRVTVADIAERAGVSRPTVYKYVGTRDAVTSSLVAREIEAFFTELEEVVAAQPTAEARLVEGIAFTVVYAEDHELFQRLLDREPHVVLPYLTTGGEGVLSAAVEHISPYLEGGDHALASTPPPLLAETAARLAISLILTPSEASADPRAFIRALLGT